MDFPDALRFILRFFFSVMSILRVIADIPVLSNTTSFAHARAAYIEDLTRVIISYEN